MILGTGLDLTTLSREAATRLEVAFDAAPTVKFTGLVGSIPLSPVTLPRLTLGGLQLPNRRAGVGKGIRQPIDGILGFNVLSAFEIDLDIPNRVATFYPLRNCADHTPPDRESFVRLPTFRLGSGLYTQAKLDGKPVPGLLNTGASRTTVGLQAAAKTNVDLARLRSGPSRTVQVLDDADLTAYPAQFQELQIGTDIVRGPTLNVSDFGRRNNMLIVGNDYFARHRTWLALGGSAIFVSEARQQQTHLGDRP